MAKIKKEFHIELSRDLQGIVIWCNRQHWAELMAIEGVAYAYTYTTIGQLYLSIDPRYDINEVADEVRTLLQAEVPDVFRTIE